MKFSLKSSQGLKREYEIVIAAQILADLEEKEFSRLGKKAKIDGFRPGKIPMAILRQKFEHQVTGEVLEKAVQNALSDLFKNENLDPIHQPKVDLSKFEKGQDLVFTTEFEIYPQFTVSDFSKLSLEKPVVSVDDKRLQDALEEIRKATKITKKLEKERKTKTGDVIQINFDGSVDGKKMPGMKGENYDLELGSKSFIDNFEDQLVGRSVGDHVEVHVTFPENYHEKTLSGRKALFEVDILAVSESIPAELNDELAVQHGLKDFDALKKDIEKMLASQYEELARAVAKRHLLDALDKEYNFEIPDLMLEQEFKGIKMQQDHHKRHKHDHNDPNHVHGPDCDHDHDHEPELSEDEMRKIAKRRVKLGLLFSEIAKTHDIKVTQKELQQALFLEMRNYPGQEAQIYELFKKNPKMLDNFKGPILENKTVDLIMGQASVKEKKMSYDEAVKALG